jgi:phosphoribosylaminoimidazole-succinocarboxamide synthase
MKKLEMMYEGKAKRVYKTDSEDLFVIEYKDDATAFNGEKKGTIMNKGIINNTMSSIIFKMLEEGGVKTHLVEQLSDNESLVKAVKIVPLEVIVRNISAGSFAKRYGVEEGIKFPFPSVEFSYKNDELGDPLMVDDHALVLKIATKEEIELIKNMALKVNDLLKSYFLSKDITLVDFKLEFGKIGNEIVLADEISPDTCRLWDIHTNKKLDKDRFRRDLGDVEEAYEEVLKRLRG